MNVVYSFEKSVLLFLRVFFCFVLIETDNFQTKIVIKQRWSIM